MNTMLLMLQLAIVVALILLIMIQKRDNDTLAGLAGNKSTNGQRTTGSTVGRMTMMLGIAFMANSLFMAKFHLNEVKRAKYVLESIQSNSIQDLSNKVPEAQ